MREWWPKKRQRQNGGKKKCERIQMYAPAYLCPSHNIKRYNTQSHTDWKNQPSMGIIPRAIPGKMFELRVKNHWRNCGHPISEDIGNRDFNGKAEVASVSCVMHIWAPPVTIFLNHVEDCGSVLV
jgi:hypothetical protein